MPSPAVGILVDLSIPKLETPPPPLSPPRSPPPPDESPSASPPVDASSSPSEAAARPAEDARVTVQDEDLLECETFDFACVSPKSLDGSKCCAEDETSSHELASTLGGSNPTAAAPTVCCTTGISTPPRKVKPLSPLKPRQMVELFKEANALACHISINYGSAKKDRRMCSIGGSNSSPAVGSPVCRPSSSRSPMVSPSCRQPRAAGCLPSKGQKEQAWTSMKENIPHNARGTEITLVPKGGCSVACTAMPPPALPAGMPYDRRRSGRLATRGSQAAAASRRVSLHGPSGDGLVKIVAGSRRSSIGPGRGGASSARGSADSAAAAAQRLPAGHLTPRPVSAAAAVAAAAIGCRLSSSSIESVSATAPATTAIRSRPMAVPVDATTANVHTRRSLAPQGTASLLGATKAGGTPAARLESATGNGRRTSAVGVRAAGTLAVPAAGRRSSAIVGVGVHQRLSSAPIVAATGATTADCAIKEQQQQPLRAPYELRRSLRAPVAAPAARATSCSAEPLVKAHGSIAVKSSLQKPASAAKGVLSSVKPCGTSAKSMSGAVVSARPAAVPALRPMKAVQLAAATASSVSARAGAAGSRAAVLPSVATSSRRTSSIGIGANGRSGIPSTGAAVASRALPPIDTAVATPKNRRSLLPTRLPSASLSARLQCNGSSEQLSTLVDLGASPVL